MIGNMKWKKTAARWFAGEESGQGLVEYALILLLIAVAVSAGPAVAGDFDRARDALN